MKDQFKKLTKAIFCGIVIISIFFFITEFEAYRPQSMPFIGSMAEPFKHEGVYIQAKAYDSSESQAYLSRDLLSQGFQPIQITIQNNTGKTYFLSKKGVDASTASTGQVAFSFTRSAIPRSIAFKVAGFFFWPLIIPGTIDSIMTIKSHRKMKADFHAKSIKEEKEAVLPYSTVHRMIFVPTQKYADEFALYLQEQKSGHFYPFQVKPLSAI